MLSRLALILGVSVALAGAAIELNPSRPLLFGTHRLIPRAPAKLEDNETGHGAVWNQLQVRQSQTNPQNRNSFPIRYVSNDQHYRRGGPLFLFIGGPWELQEHLVEQGHFFDIAKNMSAYLVANELRYYGESIPAENATRLNLRYLALAHILPDIANLITHLMYEVLRDPGATVILAGVGFSASIAQWTRQRYQHLVQGVWSSSGMVKASTNFVEFTEVVGENIRRFGSDECYNAIWQGFRVAENLIDAGLSTTLDNLFDVCNPIKSDDPVDVEAFLNGIFNEISLQAVDIDLRENIDRMCQILTDPEKNNSLTALSNWLTGLFPDAECLVMDFESITEAYQVTDWQDEMLRNGERQWLYHRCTALGWPLTSSSPYQPFGRRISPDLFMQICERVFNDWLTPDVFRALVRDTNIFWGGGRPDVQRVYHTHGSLDPWRYAGVYFAYGNSYSRVIWNATHGEDLASISEDDSYALRLAKERVAQEIRRWVYQSSGPPLPPPPPPPPSSPAGLGLL
ncbi:thymus-specific serine protease-like [Topomyia yanbarensis]|uniref:thymus-specific serine protease-like n=1 Tax=Topomyia yanbarensis TaxID=2498891 RepID=UPI00273B9218|nr:thymus-specific serine protease-like [Topomyia yanbarensis]